MGIEFYIFDGDVWYIQNGINEKLDEDNIELIHYIIDRLKSQYPQAYSALAKVYNNSAINSRYYQFLIARRFIKCNFGQLDSTQVDLSDRFNFENVQCPLRGECPLEGVVCKPKMETTLSKSETRVADKLYNGFTIMEISETLFISPNTVKNHIKSIYSKLGVHDKGGFFSKAKKIFK